MMAVIPLASGQAAVFHDADGTEVKVKLAGPGQGTIELVGGVLTGAAIDTLSLTGTTAATKLKISTRGGAVAGTTVNDVAIDNALNELGALKHFKGKKVTLTGDFTADGSIENFHVRSLGNGASVNVNGDVGRFKAESLASNAQLDVSGTLREFVARLLASGSVVEANQLDLLKVKQQAMGASFNIGAGGLAQAKFGWIYDTAVAAEGAIGSVVVTGDAMGSGFASNINKGSDGVLGTIDDFVMDSAATGYVGAVTFRGNVGGTYPNQMVAVVSSDGIGDVQTRRHSQQANLKLREDAAPQFIPLSISQLTAGITGFDDDEIWIAVFGEEIAIPPQGVAPPPAQNYYLIASQLQNGDPQLMSTQSLVPSASTPNLPMVPSSTIAAWALNTTNVWDSNLQFPVPSVGNQFTGRILISAGAPVQAQVNQDTYHSVSAPSAADPTDPSTGTFYDFLEFTVTNSATDGISLDMDTSQVDSFGMPIGLQFFEDAAGTQEYQAAFKGNTTKDSMIITGVTNISSLVNNDYFGTGQPVVGAGIASGTVVTTYDITGDTITLNKPAAATNSDIQFYAYPGGIVGVEKARNVILTGTTKDNLYEFLRGAIESGSSQARPFLQSVAPYTVQDAVQVTSANTTSVVITTADTTGLNVGDNVTVSGVLGNLAANGTFQVAAVTPTSFTLGSPIGNAAYTSGGVWSIPGSSTTPLVSGSSTSGQPVVITTGNTFGLSNGDTVLIEGAAGNAAVNGLHVVSGVTANSFTIAGVNGNGSAISDGAWQRVQAITNMTGQNDPIVITTGNTDSINVGGVIRVFDVGGNTAANGLFVVEAKTANSITLGSPAGSDPYQSGGTWTGSQSGSGAVTGATNGGQIQINTASTAGLNNGYLVQISAVGGNQAANEFYLVGDLTPTSFTLSGSFGSGVYTSGGTWTVHQTAMRFVSPKDIVEAIKVPQDSGGLNNYYNEMIDNFFLQYYTGTMNGRQGGGQTFSLVSTAFDHTNRIYTGQMTNTGTANGNYALQLKDPTGTDKTVYNIYYPWFTYNSGANNNAPSPDVYTPVFTLQEAPSWITANAWQTQSASQMIFACDAIFADNVARANIDMTGTNAVQVLGDLENSISAAFNRGIVLNAASSWDDTTQWFPVTGTYNYWVEYWHQNGLTYSDLAYAFPYDDKFGASTNLNIGNVGLAKVTLGSWGSATATTTAFQNPPTTAAPDTQITLTAQVTGSNPTGDVSFFINGIPINPMDDSQSPPMYPVTIDGSGIATVTATLPPLPSGADAATYTVTAVYSGDATHLPSVAYTSLALEEVLTVSVAPASGALGATVQVNTTLPDQQNSGTLTYKISKSDGSNEQVITTQQVTMQNMSQSLAIPTNVVTFTGNASGTNMITGITNMADLQQGQVISGAGVPTGTTITGLGANSITLDNIVSTGSNIAFTSNGAGADLPITVVFTPTNNQLPTVTGSADFSVTASPYSLGLVPGSGALGSTPTMTVTLPGPPYNGTIQFNISRPDGTDVQSLGSVNVNSTTLTNGNQVAVNNLAIPSDLLTFTAYPEGTNVISGISTVSGWVQGQTVTGAGVPAGTTLSNWAPPSLVLTNAAGAGASTSPTAPQTLTVSNGVTITGWFAGDLTTFNVTSVNGWNNTMTLNGLAITGNGVGAGNTINMFTAGTATLNNNVAASTTPVTFTSSANGSAYPITAVWTPSGASSLTSAPQLFAVT